MKKTTVVTSHKFALGSLPEFASGASGADVSKRATVSKGTHLICSMLASTINHVSATRFCLPVHMGSFLHLHASQSSPGHLIRNDDHIDKQSILNRVSVVCL